MILRAHLNPNDIRVCQVSTIGLLEIFLRLVSKVTSVNYIVTYLYVRVIELEVSGIWD